MKAALTPQWSWPWGAEISRGPTLLNRPGSYFDRVCRHLLALCENIRDCTSPSRPTTYRYESPGFASLPPPDGQSEPTMTDYDVQKTPGELEFEETAMPGDRRERRGDTLW
jgi:hypothetical protein